MMPVGRMASVGLGFNLGPLHLVTSHPPRHGTSCTLAAACSMQHCCSESTRHSESHTEQQPLLAQWPAASGFIHHDNGGERSLNVRSHRRALRARFSIVTIGHH